MGSEPSAEARERVIEAGLCPMYPYCNRANGHCSGCVYLVSSDRMRKMASLLDAADLRGYERGKAEGAREGLREAMAISLPVNGQTEPMSHVDDDWAHGFRVARSAYRSAIGAALAAKEDKHE